MGVLTFIERTLYAAGDLVMTYFRKPMIKDLKDDGSIVTTADRKSEALIAERICAAFPCDGILSEESGATSNDRFPMRHQWIVDPLDGSSNFAAGLEHFCISIARAMFLPDGRLVVMAGGIYDPVRQKLYLAERGYGATLNGGAISIRPGRPFPEPFVGTSIYYGRTCREHDQDIAFYDDLTRYARVRRMGAAAYDLALVAEGVLDGYVEDGLMSWDTAAGSLLVEAAGGVVVNIGTSDFSVEGRSVIAGSLETVEAIQQIATRHYED